MTGKTYLITIAIGICLLASALPNAVFAETSEESLKRQLVQSLSEQLKSLQSQLADKEKAKLSTTTEPINIRLKNTSATFKKLQNQYGPDDTAEGKYMLQVEITAGKDDLYIPVSITTAMKSNGLIYQVEGSERASSSATVSCKGENAVIVTSGSISYCKVPALKTVSFKVFAIITGELREEYRVVVGRINYKLNPNDVRYKKYLVDIRSKMIKFH